jgi:hypothetical protein
MNRATQNRNRGYIKSKLLTAALGVFGTAQAQVNFPSPPDAAEQEKVLSDATSYAMSHEANLPNFICTQTTRRFENYNSEGWRPIDVISERLTYFDHREAYKVMTLNGQPVSLTHDQLRGASSSGEFGSLMRAIFLPWTQTKFTWQEWYTLRGRRMHVYAYQVRASRSVYHIEVPEQSLDLITAYHGLIYIDFDNHFVNRITLNADEIPPSFPIQNLSVTLDYDYRRIGDTEYLLPLQFELSSREGGRFVKNDVAYDDYSKFHAVSVIIFDPNATQK